MAREKAEGNNRTNCRYQHYARGPCKYRDHVCRPYSMDICSLDERVFDFLMCACLVASVMSDSLQPYGL